MERVFVLLEQAEEEKLESTQGSSLGSSQGSSLGSSQGTVEVKPEPEAAEAPTLTAKVGPPPPKKKRKSLMARMQGEVTDLTLPAENLKKEVHEYLGAMIFEHQSPLEWWKTHEIMYPNVASLAKKYLSIPPTEVNYNKYL